MKNRYPIADLHCHPNLKTFGQSFSSKFNKKSDLWYAKPPHYFSKVLNSLLGITRFSQTDFTAMAQGNIRCAFVSLYPFEKGFFTNRYFWDPISARLAAFVTSIGYRRIRNIQQHTDYFNDLEEEYAHLCQGRKTNNIDGSVFKWDFADSWSQIEEQTAENNNISVVLTIEGAHVFNSGLEKFGKKTREGEVLENIDKVKNWQHPPFFITFAHNFNNDLCGHARSLNQLGPLVDQFENINTGFTPTGIRAAKALLSTDNGRRILLDIKHMSLKSRLDYYELLKSDYNNEIPVIVSHGAVTGTNLQHEHTSTVDQEFLCPDDINFYDEELITIAKTKGLFALQMDGNRLTTKAKQKKSVFSFDSHKALEYSAGIVWNQLQHIAEILDGNGLNAWDTACFGTDFDGTINPLAGVWTTADLQALLHELEKKATHYLSTTNALSEKFNKSITATSIIQKFAFENTQQFLKRNL